MGVPAGGAARGGRAGRVGRAGAGPGPCGGRARRRAGGTAAGAEPGLSRGPRRRCRAPGPGCSGAGAECAPGRPDMEVVDETEALQRFFEGKGPADRDPLALGTPSRPPGGVGFPDCAFTSVGHPSPRGTRPQGWGPPPPGASYPPPLKLRSPLPVPQHTTSLELCPLSFQDLQSLLNSDTSHPQRTSQCWGLYTVLPWDPIQMGGQHAFSDLPCLLAWHPSMPPRDWDPRLDTQAPCVPFTLAPSLGLDSQDCDLRGPPSRVSPTFRKAAPSPKAELPLEAATPPQHSSVGWISLPPPPQPSNVLLGLELS